MSPEDLMIIKAIFRGADSDSLISFGEWRDEAAKWKAPVPVVELELAPQVLADQNQHSHYLSFTTLRKEAVRDREKFQAFLRSREYRNRIFFNSANEFASSICAVVMDVDVGRPDNSRPEKRMPWHEALAIAEHLVDSGSLPEPSLLAPSGKGGYLVWLLEESGGLAPVATAENCETFELIARTLAGRLECVGVDEGATVKPVHWFKSPGSIAFDYAGEPIRVTYMPFSGQMDAMRRYPILTLRDLCGAPTPEAKPATLARKAGLPRPRPFSPEEAPLAAKRTIRDGGQIKARRKSPRGWWAPRFRRICEIEKLSEFRRGMEEGCRVSTLFFYSQDVYFLEIGEGKDADLAREVMRDAVLRLNSTFRPPLPTEEAERTMKWKKKPRRRASNYAVVKALGVTEGEVDAMERHLGIEVKSLLPHGLKLARAEMRNREKEARKAAKERRRAFVDDLIDRGLGVSEIVKKAAEWELPVQRSYVYQRRKRKTARELPVAA